MTYLFTYLTEVKAVLCTVIWLHLFVITIFSTRKLLRS